MTKSIPIRCAPYLRCPSTLVQPREITRQVLLNPSSTTSCAPPTKVGRSRSRRPARSVRHFDWAWEVADQELHWATSSGPEPQQIDNAGMVVQHRLDCSQNCVRMSE